MQGQLANHSVGSRQAATSSTARNHLQHATVRSSALRTFQPLERATTAIRVASLDRVGDIDDLEKKLLDALKLHKELKQAQVEREERERLSAPALSSMDGNTGSAFAVKTFNAISPVGLKKFPRHKYAVSGEDSKLPASPMAIMLRSHKLQVSEVPPTVRCIVRCGAGVNNIPLAEMTELGIPVFNTPGANANAVKELVVCGLLLASRGILEGNAHVDNVINKEENMDYDKISKRIEKDKAMFVGSEIEGKTLGVIGLGAIGGKVVNAALALGMKVVGFDPVLSLEAAWKLPGDRMEKANSVADLLKVSDYVTVHVPYIKDATHHMINANNLPLCKPGVHLLNFSRGEIIDGEAVRDMWAAGTITGKYISDFADPFLSGHPRHRVLPHLGASTEEAEDNSAAMAADTIMDFLQTGTIRNSVNFPTTVLPKRKEDYGPRLCIVHRNVTGVLGKITTFIANMGVNVTQEINTSRGNISYTVVDLDSELVDPAQFQVELCKACPGVISSRFLGFQPGTFFHVEWSNTA